MILKTQDITLFVIDDEFHIRDSLTLLIESTGLKVESFESAQDFLEKLNPCQPGCLLLDTNMPQMNGLELQEELKKKQSEIPIIFMSGQADITISSQAFRAGAIDFLEKPFDNELLLARIDEMVEKLKVSWPKFRKKKQILDNFAHLTSREKEVFKLTVQNHSNKQTARILEISNRTVDIHRARVMNKMQADSLNTLVVMAITADLLLLPEIEDEILMDNNFQFV